MKQNIFLLAVMSLAALACCSCSNTNSNAVNKATIVPHKSWTCNMAEGIPYPQEGEVVLDVVLDIDQVFEVGQTQYGQRQAIVIKGGTVTGPNIQSSIEPGGLEYELVVSNGVVELEQLLVLKTSDGKYIYSRNAGVGLSKDDIRVVMDFEAPENAEYAWLNQGIYLARRKVDFDTNTIVMTVYKNNKEDFESDNIAKINITKPEHIPYQSWNYRKAATSEKPGEEIISELVTLGPSISVGQSKRGVRNIIPITGGELKGMVKGKVLPGGADYQNLSNPVTIEARYLWQADNGEIIIVRNGGQFGSLVPDFESRVDGDFSWLNSDNYLSSNPQMGDGGVFLTMYKSE